MDPFSLAAVVGLVFAGKKLSDAKEEQAVMPSMPDQVSKFDLIQYKFAQQDPPLDPLNLEPNTRYLVLLDSGLSPEAKYGALILELSRIFCGHLGIDSDAWWVDRKDLDLNRTDLEADAVAFIVCRRRGLALVPHQRFSDCRDQDRELPPISLNAVFQAVNYIEEMGKALWRKPRKQGRS